MSTRATIAVRLGQDSYDAVYLHQDGYPQHTGEVLRARHTSLDQAKSLVAGGDIRSLDAETGVADYFGECSNPERIYSQDALVERANQMWAQYLYVFDGEAWTCVGL